jgi:TATA-box binding protein (TBP) (component of TFIID and TFIIIB)
MIKSPDYKFTDEKDKTGKPIATFGGSSKEVIQKAKEVIKSRKVGVPVIKDLSILKEMPEYKPLDFPGFKYATLIHGVPVVVHENGQMFIIQNTTHKKRDMVIKHINQAVKDGYAEIRELDKEIHFIDNQMVCDIKKMLKEQK